MPKDEAFVVLYAADLAELREWVGCRDEQRFREALDAIRDDEDSGWEGELEPRLEQLLRRVVFDGTLYAGLSEEDRYFLTQLLVDLFDESVDHDALTESLPLGPILDLVRDVPADGRALLNYLVRGRELNGDGVLWETGRLEECQPFLGFVTREEAGQLARTLESTHGQRNRGGARPPARGARLGGNLLKQIQSAAEECVRADLDLVSMVWMSG